MSGEFSQRPILFRHRLEAWAATACIVVLGRMPNWLLKPFAILFAALIFDLFRVRRSTSLENLERAFPEKSVGERRRIARASYRHALYGFVEFARLSGPKRQSHAQWVAEVENEQVALELRKKGAFVISVGHLGNWEFLAHYWAEQGHPLAALYKPMHNPILDRQFMATRQGSGIEYISTRLGRREMWRRLSAQVKRGAGIAFLTDQDARRSGIFVPFFGHPASTATGPVTLALRKNLPILPAFGIRLAPFRFRLVVGEPIYPPAGGRSPQNVEALTRKHVEVLEEAIRSAPEQYFWFHRRWKTRPKA